MSDDLRYPIGAFDYGARFTPDMRGAAIATIAGLPQRMRAAVAGLSDAQLDTPYRPGGWTVRQLAHHVADSHVNGYIRTKLALTEPEPTIKPYDQGAWAPLPDSGLPIEASLAILEGLHARWTALWRALTAAQLERTFRHPEIGLVTLEQQLHSYAWHSRHHVAHILGLRERAGWPTAAR